MVDLEGLSVTELSDLIVKASHRLCEVTRGHETDPLPGVATHLASDLYRSAARIYSSAGRLHGRATEELRRRRIA